ncbi:hypothetical protein MCAP1_001343 [Malassezia caprae]|uniref:SEC7 domain-containing protein n=1 Tax=Malassezia caprae TaxID=1381934 RepID=A0AAF0E6H8_9BASI|nr:hypothetical protein MCAP1_001343 [Malassezia caprae]
MPVDAVAVAADVPGSGGEAAGQDSNKSDTGMASARLHAIAKLRRAASQREVRHATPRTAPPPEPVPQKKESQPTAEASAAEDAPEEDAPAETPQAALLPSPLPSLEQLRQRLLRERKPTGLSRSASASATSQVARAYTMQKLLGSATPLPYHDMFAFVRSVSQANVSSDTPPTPPRNEAAAETSPKRAALLRSVSARDGARIRRVRRIGRHDASSDTPPADSPEAMPSRAPASASAFSDDSSSNTAHESTGSSGWRVSLYNYDSGASSRQASVGTTAPVGSSATTRASDSMQGTGVTSAAPQNPSRPSLELPTPPPTGAAPISAARGDVRQSPRAAPALREAHVAMDWHTTERGSLKSPPLYRQSPPFPSTHTPGRSPDTSLDDSSESPQAVWQKKPLPRLPPVPSARAPRDSVSGDTLPLVPRANATPTHVFPDMLAPMLARSASVGTGRRTPRDDDDERKEARVARLWGSLRRKTSMRALRRPNGHALAPSTASSGDSAWATVALLMEAEAPLHEPVVTLPVTPAMLMQWNQTLDRPVRDLLSYLPAEVPCDIALDPPRRLVCVLPLLQAAGDKFVKLRFAFVFQDVLVLAKPPLILQGDESVTDVMLRKLSQAPALNEPCVPFAVLDLAQVQLQRHGELSDSELSALIAPHMSALHARLDTTLAALVCETGLLRDESDAAAYAAAQARLLYVCEPLDRTVLWRFLQEYPHMLTPFVSQYRVRGVPLDVALRHVLLDLPRPESAASMEALLLAFAGHWYASNTSEWPAHTLDSVTDLTWAMVALNDALHQPDGHWAAYDPSVSLSDFIVGFRAHGASQAVSDRELGEIYLSVRTSPLSPGGTDVERRTISIDAHAWHALGALGVPSAPVRVRIDAPDPDLQVRLVGPGLLADPPVLSFAHSAHAQFTLCTATPGPHDLIFVRMGRHARFYGGHAPAPGMAALPRSVQVRAGREVSTPRLTLSLVPTVPGTTHTFYLTDTPSAQRVTALLQSTIDAARAHARRLGPAEWDVRALCRRVLEASLLPLDDASRARRLPPPATGQALVQTTRDNSLLMHVLRPS